MNITKIFAAVVLVGTSAVSHALPSFTIQESAVPGTPSNEVVADQITLRYEASITQTGDASFATFTETGYFNGTGFVLGTAPASTFMNGPGGTGYGFYGTFTVSGTVAFVGTTALATFTSGSVSFFADPDKNTTKSIAAGDAAATILNDLDDILLGSSDSIVPLSQANVPLVGGQAGSGGSYSINFGELLLTTAGSSYFIQPNPFYLSVTLTGENESFNPALTPGNYVGIAQGDASAGFNAVPEPGSLALLGLGLLGLGTIRRRATK